MKRNGTASRIGKPPPNLIAAARTVYTTKPFTADVRNLAEPGVVMMPNAFAIGTWQNA